MSPEKQRIAIAKAVGADFLFVLMKRGVYYLPNGHGYTGFANKAWKLSEEEADKYVYPHDDPVVKRAAPILDYLNDRTALIEAIVAYAKKTDDILFLSDSNPFYRNFNEAFCRLLFGGTVRVDDLGSIGLWAGLTADIDIIAAAFLQAIDKWED